MVLARPLVDLEAEKLKDRRNRAAAARYYLRYQSKKVTKGVVAKKFNMTHKKLENDLARAARYGDHFLTVSSTDAWVNQAEQRGSHNQVLRDDNGKLLVSFLDVRTCTSFP